MQASKKRSKIRPKSSQNHLRGRLEGPWAPPWAPFGPQVRKGSKKRSDKHQRGSSFLSCFSYFCPKWRDQFFNEFPGGLQIVFLRILVAKSIKKGGQNSLFEAFSARAGFLKNVLPPARELNSQGPTPPKSDSKLCVFFARSSLRAL